jgi:23S rRNA (pseudouridine1915-N3)-methyltransferase
MKVLIRIVGRKPSERWLEEGVNMYQQRLTKVMELQTEWHKSNSALIQNVEQDLRKEHVVVLLDPSQGKQYKSEDFAEYFYQWMQQGGSRLVFVIGGAEGLPTELLDKTDLPKVSLSKLTFTHQMTRLLLAEQVYRAYEIHKGSEYHK